HDDVSQLAHLERNESLEAILEGDGFRLVDPEACCRVPGPSRAHAARARIARILRGELPTRAAAFERAVRGAQCLQRLGIKVRAAALVFDLAVPQEPEGLQHSQDLVGAAGYDTRTVEVLHPHEPAPAVAAGVDEAA